MLRLLLVPRVSPKAPVVPVAVRVEPGPTVIVPVLFRLPAVVNDRPPSSENVPALVARAFNWGKAPAPLNVTAASLTVRAPLPRASEPFPDSSQLPPVRVDPETWVTVLNVTLPLDTWTEPVLFRGTASMPPGPVFSRTPSCSLLTCPIWAPMADE